VQTSADDQDVEGTGRDLRGAERAEHDIEAVRGLAGYRWPHARLARNDNDGVKRIAALVDRKARASRKRNRGRDSGAVRAASDVCDAEL
jgi:hypothetical protein